MVRSSVSTSGDTTSVRFTVAKLLFALQSSIELPVEQVVIDIVVFDLIYDFLVQSVR